MGISELMSIGVSAINAQQVAMEVTAHNIANISTEGYARQETQFTARTPVATGALLRGLGVDVASIRGAEDRFFNRSVWLGRMEFNYYEARGESMSSIEDVFNETTDGIGLAANLTDFWATWSDLANNAEGSAERASVTGMASVLSSKFRTTYDRLVTIQRNIDTEVNGTVTDVNNILKQIASINDKISNIERGGGNANDYRVMRTAFMNDLSEEIDFNYFEMADGAVHISVGAGRTLVESGTASSLEARVNPTTLNRDIIFISANGQEADITDEIEGGRLGGLIETRDVDIEDAMTALDDMAFALVSEINALHTTGYTLNGTTGQNFFVPLASADGAARLIELDPAIASDLDNIVAAIDDASGDNRMALAIASLREADVMDGGQSTISEFFNTLVGTIGIAAQNASRQYEQSSAILSQLETARESSVGVSIEEEMANLVRYQQAYQAAARILNAASDLVEILNSLR
jgi:flagellar hook-associated protein 1